MIGVQLHTRFRPPCVGFIATSVPTLFQVDRMKNEDIYVQFSIFLAFLDNLFSFFKYSYVGAKWHPT